MKKLLVVPVLFLVYSVSGQSEWKQSLRYRFHVKFNVADKSLDALMKLEYINHSPDTLYFLWFHVWPNSYRNDRTLYSEQLLENGDTRFYFSTKDQKGYLNRLSFRINGDLATTEDHPEFIDVIKVLLPRPLLPGDSISIGSSFHLRLPYNFNGFGYSQHHFELRNWYPEPAVYDKKGWHPMPMLIQGGAYHEASVFEVDIELPASYLVVSGASSELVSGTKDSSAYRLHLSNANSLALILDNRLNQRNDSVMMAQNEKIDIRYYYTGGNSNRISDNILRIKTDLKWLSQKLGKYPYQQISIVETKPMPDQDFSGLVSIGSASRLNNQRKQINRAVAAQWLQAILLTDQRNQPWLSKGLIEYYGQQLDSVSPPKDQVNNDNLWLRVAESDGTTQPVTAMATSFSTINDTLMPGDKAALWFTDLRKKIGPVVFDQNIHQFMSAWNFDHPDSSDLRISMSAENKDVTETTFKKLYQTQVSFESTQTKKIRPAFAFSAKETDKYNYIGLAPIPGYNRYDGFMLGALIHNINLPENKFEFVLAPQYAFGSGHLVGLGRVSYTWHPKRKFSAVAIGINGAHYDSNKATDSVGNMIYENFTKIVPYIRIDFKPSNPRSSVHKWIDFSSYLINEQNYSDFSYSSKDSLIHPGSVVKSFRYVNQISLNMQNTRSLYPYDLRMEFQQSELFYRINFRANYFMNYPDGGGLQLRFFASKFGVWHQENLTQVGRYEPKLLGVNGEEDYLYQNYFIGRTASYAYQDISVPNGGVLAQQIMNRDGGLKLRIDESDYVQGKSANWVSSVGFNTTLPAHMFPFPVPIRLFFDVGTYAEAWESNPLTSRFLFTGGIELSLFKNVLNIYAPLFYSSDFNEALNGYNFGKKITFSIDIQNLNCKKMIRKLAGQ